MPWPARTESDDARRPGEGGIHGLGVCEEANEAIARRHGDMAFRFGLPRPHRVERGRALANHTVTMFMPIPTLPRTDFEYGQS
jgi:hypothetical protein